MKSGRENDHRAGDEEATKGAVRPAVLARVSDLYFASRIESTARNLGWDVIWVGEVQAGDDPDGGNHEEGVAGNSPPARLVLVDLNQAEAAHWIRVFREKNPKGEVRIIAFGSHKDAAALAEAKKAGADQALARSRFVEILPDLLRQQET
jgi:hypothetical protein